MIAVKLVASERVGIEEVLLSLYLRTNLHLVAVVASWAGEVLRDIFSDAVVAATWTGAQSCSMVLRAACATGSVGCREEPVVIVDTLPNARSLPADIEDDATSLLNCSE